ncbi:unnamed protein product [Dicrocoelium dendriticum]|nr:unnamed protein product [Dicrocoelium dendriticum]
MSLLCCLCIHYGQHDTVCVLEDSCSTRPIIAHQLQRSNYRSISVSAPSFAMALNKYMHPRNVYRGKKPSFKELAQKFSFFREVTEADEDGRVTLDFKVPSNLAALSKALLLNDFELDVEFPSDRLVPTVPLRLNYILWLEDLIRSSPIVVLDVGVGASCIYPLLGAKKNGWRFIGTEIDTRNYAVACANVARNSLHHLINIIHVKGNDSSLDLVLNSKEVAEPYLTAVMANPPFYCNTSEAIGLMTSRSVGRPSAKTVTSAARHESQTRGGEVFYCMRLARDSVKYATRVGVFTVMLGKKSSVVPMKRILRKLGIPRMSVYELCQGRIMRWGLAWTFQPNVEFPESEFRRLSKLEKPPLTWILPPTLSCVADYSVDAVINWLRTEFKKLKMRVLDQKNPATMGGTHLSIWATENTWTHSRRKRREAQRLAAQGQNPEPRMDCDIVQSENVSVDIGKQNGENIKADNEHLSVGLKRPHPDAQAHSGDVSCAEESFSSSTEAKRLHVANLCEEGDAWLDDESLPSDLAASQQPDLIIHANVFVEQQFNDTCPSAEAADVEDESMNSSEPQLPLVMKIAFINGSCREAANQILCYLKNILR